MRRPGRMCCAQSRKVGTLHDRPQSQWQHLPGRLRSGDAAAVRPARRAPAPWGQVRLWVGPMRRLHGDDRRHRRAVMPHAAVRRREQAGQDRGRPGLDGQARRIAKRLYRGAGRAMRLLHRRNDHARAGAAGTQPVAHGRPDPAAHGNQPVPLRHPHAHPARGAASGRQHQGGKRGSNAMNPARPGGPTRRELLAAGGALVVAFVLRPREIAAATDAKPATPELPGSLEKQPLLDGWIRIDADGKVTVFTGKAELGQGIKTALLQIAAEELGVKPARITVVTADTQRTADEGYTAGSHSMQDSGTAIRHAAAQARAILIVLAAPRLGVTPESLKVEDGVIRSGTGSVAYGELVSGQTLHVRATPDIALRDPASYTVIGQSIQRVDIPAKVRGAVAYVQDLRRPGMVHGRIVRPPSPGAALIALDSSAAEQMPGVLKVVRDGNFVAVIAQREYQAITASRTLARGARWQERETLPAQSDLYKTLQALPAKDIVILDRGAPAAPGARSLAATYPRPYQMHASIGPSCAMAQLVDGNYTVWTHSQGVFPLRRALAELLGQGEQQVRCIHVEGSGCYGHNGADDVAADAALLARALPGRPVRVQWMREDEHMWEPYGPPMASSVSATLDGGGSIASW